jgi:hypothetical protein
MKGLYALHIVYDDRLSRLAPGSAMLLMGMRQAIDGRYAFFNLLSGFGYYKLRWQAQMTETRIAQIYRTGRLLFWRRVFGDWKRRVFPDKSKETPVLFNPLRRDVSEREGEQTEPGKVPKLQTDPEERERIAALIAKARAGQGEFLSAAELAAVMPFQTQRVPGVGKARGARPSLVEAT